MILADTSVWVDHLRKGDPSLMRLLDNGQILTHPFIVGEIALGNLRQRDEVLGSMRELPQIAVATDPEVLNFIGEQALFGRGIGYVDAHLLASLRLEPGSRLWTRDQRLHEVADAFGLAVP